MYDVAFSPCKQYEYSEVRTALENALASVTDFGWLRIGMTVAVKVNLLTFAHPDRAVTTHPMVVCALSDMLTERGAKVIVGDSPGGIFAPVYVGRIYEHCGMTAVLSHGGELNRDYSEKHVSFPEAKVCREFDCTAWLTKADAIIDLCKLKTHGMMTLTAGIKNLFGAIPGTKKPEYHFRFSNPKDFADTLVDLCAYFKPVLTICDAVTAMEGNGPSAGTPRHLGYIAAAVSPYALDESLCRFISLPIERVPTLAAAKKRGLLTQSPIIFNMPEPVTDFVIPETGSGLLFEGRGDLLGKLRGSFMGAILASRPALNAGKCVGCRKCEEVCPAKAITMKKGRPTIDRKKCIRCFCCQEFCEHGALSAHRPPVARLLNREAK